MDRYEHILAPVDFSVATPAVIRRAVRESRLHGARLTLFHVIEFYPEDVPPGMVPAENENPIEVYLRRAREKLDGLAAGADIPDAVRRAVTSTGAAYHEIITAAGMNGVDLIVMGYVGHWVVGALGSTALAITRHSPCDVLLVRNAGAGE